MAVLLKDLIDDPAKLKLLEAASATCGFCEEPITFADRIAEEVEDLQGRKVHTSCRQAAMGNVIEKHPIISPRIRRG